MPRRLLDLLPDLYALAWRLEGAGGAEDLVVEACASFAGTGDGLPREPTRTAAFRALRGAWLDRVAGGRAVAWPRVPPPAEEGAPLPWDAPQAPREWALMDLDEPDRTALLLREVWRLPTDEVAEVLAGDGTDARTRLRRARGDFAERLAELISRPGSAEEAATGPAGPSAATETVPTPRAGSSRCDAVRRLLDARDLGLPGPLAPEDQEHLGTCPACAAHLDRLGRAAEALEAIPSKRPLPATLRARIEAILPPGPDPGTAGDGVEASPRPAAAPALAPDPFTGAARPIAARSRTVRARRAAPFLPWIWLPVLSAGVVAALYLVGVSTRPPAPPPGWDAGADVLAADHARALSTVLPATGAPVVRLQGSPPGPPPPFPVPAGAVSLAPRRLPVAGGALDAVLVRTDDGPVSLVKVPPGSPAARDASLGPWATGPTPRCAEREGVSVCAAGGADGVTVGVGEIPGDVLARWVARAAGG